VQIEDAGGQTCPLLYECRPSGQPTPSPTTGSKDSGLDVDHHPFTRSASDTESDLDAPTYNDGSSPRAYVADTTAAVRKDHYVTLDDAMSRRPTSTTSYTDGLLLTPTVKSPTDDYVVHPWTNDDDVVRHLQVEPPRLSQRDVSEVVDCPSCHDGDASASQCVTSTADMQHGVLSADDDSPLSTMSTAPHHSAPNNNPCSVYITLDTVQPHHHTDPQPSSVASTSASQFMTTADTHSVLSGKDDSLPSTMATGPPNTVQPHRTESQNNPCSSAYITLDELSPSNGFLDDRPHSNDSTV